MARRLKKFYTIDPNKWINELGKVGVTVFPVPVKGAGETFNIAVKEDGKKPYVGKKTYTQNDLIDGLYVALEYTYNKYCNNGVQVRKE